MRAVFMGTPSASVPSLDAVAERHDVVGVYTQPERPRGRGLEPQPSPVKQAAVSLGLQVLEPTTLRTAEEHARLAALAPDVVCVVAYGQILPPEVLSVPRLGCVNVHFSLLPRWRGAAPVERALMSGDRVTGVTTMLMDEGLDTGPILLQERESILPSDDRGSLLDRLAQRGALLLVRTLEELEAGTLVPRRQPEGVATYARKLGSEETELAFELPADRLVARIRALSPEPGAYTWFRSRRLKVWRAASVSGSGVPGTIARVEAAGPEVATGAGRLRLLEVQPEGKRRMSGDEFVRGYRPAVNEQLGRSGT